MRLISTKIDKPGDLSADFSRQSNWDLDFEQKEQKINIDTHKKFTSIFSDSKK